MSTRAGTVMRALGVIIVLAAFLASEQIKVADVDPIAWLAVTLAAIAGIVLLVLAVMDYLKSPGQNEIRPLLQDVLRITVIVSGGLLVFGIWRSVVRGIFVDDLARLADPVLGVSLILLLILIFYLTRPAVAIGGSRVAGTPGAGPGTAPAGGGGPPTGPAKGGAKATPGAAQDTTAAGSTSTVASAARSIASAASSLTGLGALVAVLVVAGYAYLIGFLLQQVGASDQQWTRLVEVRSGVEAAAFAALGALIGVSIQGRSTQAAKQEAAEAEGEADAAKAKQQEAETSLEETGAESEERGATLEAIDERLTKLERSLSDSTVPSELRLGLNTLLAEEPRRFGRNVRVADATDDVLAEIRAIRDQIRSTI